MTTSQSSLDDLRSLSLDKGARPRRKKRWLGKVLLGAVALAIAGFAGKALLGRGGANAFATVKALRISPTTEFEITTANGYVIPRRRASVASKTMGRLKAVFVDEGDLVKDGQILAEVEHFEEDAAVAAATASLGNAHAVTDSLTADVTAAKAALQASQATLEERKAALGEARAVAAERVMAFTRMNEMKGQGIASDAQLDTARMQRDVGDARVLASETAVASAQQSMVQQEASVAAFAARLAAQRTMIELADAQLVQAKATRENAFIKAPLAGTVLRREAEPGEVVSPANTGGAGSKTAVVTMADFATLEVEVDVYERDIARITNDTICRIVLFAYPDRLLAGKVRLVRPTADRNKSTIKVNVSFATVPATARPEMGAGVTFLLAGADALAPDRIEVPDAAITTRDGKRGVEIVQGEKVTFTELAFGASKDGKTVVVSSPPAGPFGVLLGGETLAVRGK